MRDLQRLRFVTWASDFCRAKAANSRRRTIGGFSLIEVLVAFAILALIMVMLVTIIEFTSKAWKRTTEKMQAFQESRAAFDRITSILSQATLNTYWDYDNLQSPTKYERTSELQFLSLPMAQMGRDAAAFPTHGLFFQASTGKVSDKPSFGNMPFLLNAYGYFLEYGQDDRPAWLPDSVSPKYRFRLKEWRVPSENWTLYQKTTGATGKSYLGSTSYDWIDLSAPAAKTLAETVIALVVYPKNSQSATVSLSLADTFVYNSRTNDSATTEGQNQKHQLPPEVEVIMVAIDETSANRRWGNAATAPALTSGLFQKAVQLEDDLKTLTSSLSAQNINYIILRSTVKIRGARWSQSP